MPPAVSHNVNLPGNRPATALAEKVRAWLVRIAPTERQKLFALTIVGGALCGLVAVGFHLAIRFSENLLINRALTAQDHWILLTLLVPTAGGLACGALLYWLVPGAAGSGVPQVKLAYATESGRVPWRDAVGKFFVGALQVGSGASLGREGPTVQICAGVTSLLARLGNLSRASQRRMLPVGAAAAIAAAFNTPISAVTFTVEEIVGDLDQTMLTGVIVAAAIAAAVERSVLGVHPFFTVNAVYTAEKPISLFLYAVLGLIAALVSVAFTDSLLWLRERFKRLYVLPRWSHPAVGGLVTGGLAVVAMLWLKSGGVTGGGYEVLNQALAGELVFKTLLGLCVLKFVATVFSYSSGGAGGIFAPALFIGGMLGGVIGYLDILFFRHPAQDLGAFALVGMGAAFAAIVRAPITSVLIIFEMTGSYGLILPLMIANMTAYGLARHWRHTPVYEALLEQDGIHLPHGTLRIHADTAEIEKQMQAQ
jgi:chloride channel protein, CIC family